MPFVSNRPDTPIASRKSLAYRVFPLFLRGPLILLLGWLILGAGDCPARADTAYTVRRGDSLYAIARQHGIPLRRLIQRNGLEDKSQIRPGQTLIIPSPSAASAKPAVKRLGLPSAVQRAIAHAKVSPGRWKKIVIHHSGVDSGTVQGMDRYHRRVRHMENGLAYHFVIGNGNGLENGKIAVGPRWTKQLDGGHLISEAQNRTSIGICLIGNFEESRPTAPQLERLTALVQALLARCQLSSSAVCTHRQINVVQTRCPGRHFPLDTFLKTLAAK